MGQKWAENMAERRALCTLISFYSPNGLLKLALSLIHQHVFLVLVF